MQLKKTTIVLEAEDGRLSGPRVAAQGTGFSGRGYVTDLTRPTDRLELRFNAVSGLYDLAIRFRTPSGEKGFDLSVNGVHVSGMFPKTGDRFQTQSVGKIELRSGENVLILEKGWGYYDVDNLTFTPTAAPRPLKLPPLQLVDPKATNEARALLKRLQSTYGAVTLSGQQELADCNYVRSVTGKVPAVLGGDLIEYSPSRVAHGARPAGTIEKYIAAARAGQILSLAWHWNAPKDLLDKVYQDTRGNEIDARWYKGFYTNATTFDLAKALANPASEDYRLLLRDIDAIAVPLKQATSARVPILWRPLHEAEGGWFWWGARGAEPFKKLWQILYTRLTETHGLHNLLWVYTSGGKADWYPGDTMVDIVGTDAYPGDMKDPLSGIWETLLARHDGKKMLALSEFGGVPDLERMYRYGVRWSYFVTWTGFQSPPRLQPADLKRLYAAQKARHKSP